MGMRVLCHLHLWDDVEMNVEYALECIRAIVLNYVELRCPSGLQNAFDILGRALPMACAESSLSSSRVLAGSLGTTSVWPGLDGLISRNANIKSSSYTLWHGISLG